MRDLVKTRCFVYRGGTSRGLFFHSRDIPPDYEQRKQIFLAIMGSPDIRQIDGLGGATSHTSKAVVITPSKEEGIDIEYDFYQVGIDNAIVDDRGMCGNLLAAAGLFSVDEGLVAAREPFTVVSIRNTNTGKRFFVKIPVKDGQSLTQGTHQISGVARPGACIWEEFIEPAGAATGHLLPTRKSQDYLETAGSRYRVSVIDASHPSVFLRMEDLGLKGTETCSDLNCKMELLDSLERIRGEAACLCGFVHKASDARLKSAALPRIVLVGFPMSYVTPSGEKIEASEMDIRSYMLSMQRFHQSIAVTTAVCMAAAALVPGSIVNRIVKPTLTSGKVRIGHPSGIIEVNLEFDGNTSEELPYIHKVIVSRTARRIMEGIAYYPKPIYHSGK